MHRITGDGFIIDGGKNRYAAEDLPARDATLVTHQAMNAIQEEIAAVIEAEGGTLNSDGETYAQMVQLNTAIDNKIKAPRGYIDGFQMGWAGGAGTLNIGAGVALGTEDYWLRKTSAFTKVAETSGALQAWVAGGGNGGVKSGETGWWDTAAGTWNGAPTPTDTITNIADTAGMIAGDSLYAVGNGALFGYSWLRIAEVLSSSSIRVDGTFTTDGTGITLTHMGRWYHVWAIGKKTDPTAFDIVFTTDIGAFSGGTFGAFNVFRRIGSVFIRNVAGVPTVLSFFQQGDRFDWSDHQLTLTVDAAGWPVGGTTSAALKLLRALVPRQVVCDTDMELVFNVAAAAGKEIGASIFGGYGAVSGFDTFYADATYARMLVRRWRYFLNTGGIFFLTLSGGSSAYATAQMFIRTIGYVDRRGKDV